MSKIKTYLQETSDELLNKVSWPTWKELQDSAIVVMVASVIIAILVYLMDTAFSYSLKFIYDMIK
jgi:preprotein translocase subunit SecE